MFAEEIKKSLSKVLKELPAEARDILLEHPADLNHGDYSTNLALILAKEENKNPKELAGKIKAAWEKEGLPEYVEKIEVAGPGFLNIWLKIEHLGRQLNEVLIQGDEYGKSGAGKGKTAVIDYSSPNIAKPFGIGHLRSTNIGQALYNLYRFSGWRTIGDNHLGDWGTQFGKLIYQILKYKDIKTLSELTIDKLEKLYVEFHKEAKEKPEMEEEARKWFKKLEDGDLEAREIWQACVDISLKEFDRVYRLLEVKIDFAYGESFYQDKMEAVLVDCRKKGILQESQGAQVVEIPGEPVPGMLVKSDGATTYLLRDLATIKFRIKEWNPDLYIYEVGADQTLHFRQVFVVAEKLGYGKPNQFVHIPHGLIRWPTGKFSTRRGDTIHLEEVLFEAVKQAGALCQKAGVAKDLPEKEREVVAQAVGIGGVKYNDLKQNPKTDVIFDWEQILSLSGNSGPYLQYTYARTQSVLSKSKSRRVGKQESKSEKNTEEIAILRTIYKFPEIIAEAAEEYAPNLICNFLFELAQKFNSFYDKHRIIGEENEEFRLLLTAAAGQVLKNGLNLLGIKALERI